MSIWLSQSEIDALPVASNAWSALWQTATARWDDAGLAIKNDHNTQVLAGALAATRSDNGQLHAKVLDNLVAVMRAPAGADGLLACRRLGTYAIAADILGDAPSGFSTWLADALSRKYTGGGPDGSIIDLSNMRPNNWQHATTSRIAVDLCIGDEEDLNDASHVHRAMLGERNLHHGFRFGALAWQADQSKPVGINPPGSRILINGLPRNVDGIIPDDFRRDNETLVWPLPTSGDPVQYTYECLQALTVSTVLLARNGYPDAPEWGSKALLRAIQSQYLVAGTQCTGDDVWMPDLWHYLYGDDAAFIPLPPLDRPTSHKAGKNMGWTTWSHRGRRLSVTPPTPVDPCTAVRAELLAAQQRADTLQKTIDAVKAAVNN